jgi:hypothetical protein
MADMFCDSFIDPSFRARSLGEQREIVPPGVV